MPGGVSEDVVQYWNDAIKKLRETMEWKEVLQQNTCIDQYIDNKGFYKFMEEKEKFYQAILTEMGLAKK
jgi:tripartite-type tricarboxylate transporter receptor subunit TctC